jgi:hypothetical protein
MATRTVQVRVNAQVPERLVLLASELGFQTLPSLSVFLEDRSVAEWLISIFAELDEGRALLVGELVTYPWFRQASTAQSEGHWQPRCVAQASCPGAKRWAVEISPYSSTNQLDKTAIATVLVAACPDLLTPGVHAEPPWAQVVGKRPGYVAGTVAVGNHTTTWGPGANIQQARVFTKFAAYQNGTGATVQLDAQSDFGGGLPIPIPPNGTVAIDFDPAGICPVTLTWVNVPAGGAGYVLEYRW